MDNYNTIQFRMHEIYLEQNRDEIVRMQQPPPQNVVISVGNGSFNETSGIWIRSDINPADRLYPVHQRRSILNPDYLRSFSFPLFPTSPVPSKDPAPHKVISFLGSNHEAHSPLSVTPNQRIPALLKPIPVGIIGAPRNNYFHPDNYIMFPQRVDQIKMTEEILIYIEGYDGIDLPGLHVFTLLVIGPKRTTDIVQTKILNYSKSSPSRLTWTFFPKEPGRYTARARLGVQGDYLHSIPGSPIDFNVARDYTNISLKPRLEVIRNKEDRIRAWAVAAEYYTNRLYVADKEGSQIIVYDEKGLRIGLFGGLGDKDGKLNHPTSIVLDQTYRQLLVADKNNHRISRFALNGVFKSNFGKRGSTPGHFNFPSAVAVSSDGKVIAVADTRNHRFQIFTKAWDFVRMHSFSNIDPPSVLNDFKYPGAICFNHSGQNLYVTDASNQVYIVKVESDEHPNFININPPLEKPFGIAVDSSENILICDGSTGCIHIFTCDGNQISTIPCLGENNDLPCPMNLAIMRTGYLAVVDVSGGIRTY